MVCFHRTQNRRSSKRKTHNTQKIKPMSGKSPRRRHVAQTLRAQLAPAPIRKFLQRTSKSPKRKSLQHRMLTHQLKMLLHRRHAPAFVQNVLLAAANTNTNTTNREEREAREAREARTSTSSLGTDITQLSIASWTPAFDWPKQKRCPFCFNLFASVDECLEHTCVDANGAFYYPFSESLYS